jgi:hypothetical protein
MDKKLKYEKFNNSDNVITIDLHNGYSVIAVSGCISERHFTTTLFIKDNTIDTWKLIESCEALKFEVPVNKLNSAILKEVATSYGLGEFDYYIERYEYENRCFDLGNDIFEKEMFGEK